jgi:hypothetical protein
MASHRRGLRPSQWPVRDLLGPDVAPGRLWDARIGAALAGLLACGAAVTVVLTSGGQAVSDQPAEAIGPGPQAGPLPDTVVPAPSVPVPQVPALQVPPPAIALPRLVPAPAGPMVVGPPAVTVPRITPPRSARPHNAAPPRMRQGSTGSTESTARSKEQTLADQVASAIEHREDRPARHRADVGRLRVPAQRPADAAALLDLACADEDRSEGCRPGGRHRAPDSEVEHHVARHHHSHRDHDDRDHRERDRAEHDHDHDGGHRAHDHDDHRSGWSWFETADDDDRSEWSWFDADRDSDEDDGHRTGAHGDERNDEVDEHAVADRDDADRDDAEERDDVSEDDATEHGAEGVADSE